VISPSRRRLLAALGTVGFGGCLSLDDGGSGRSRLGEVSFANSANRPRTVDCRVEWNGEIVHDRRYELAADDSDGVDESRAVAPQTWPDEPGRFSVAARVRGHEWTRVDPGNWGYPDCFTVFGSIDGERNVLLLTSQDPTFCAGSSDA